LISYRATQLLLQRTEAQRLPSMSYMCLAGSKRFRYGTEFMPITQTYTEFYVS